MTSLLYQINNIKETLTNQRKAVNDGLLRNISDKASPIKKVELESRNILEGHHGKIYALQWSDSQHLVSAASDGKLLLWDSYSTHVVNTVTLKSSWVMTCSCAPSRNLVASGGLDNMCTIHKLNTEDGFPKSVQLLYDHNGFLSHCRFLDDNRIMTSSGDTTAALWDITTGMKTITFEGHYGDVIWFDVSDENNIMVSSSGDTSAKLWDLRTGECCQTFYGHLSDVNAVTLFPSMKAFATASDDASCRLFDIRSDQEVITYFDESCAIPSTSVAVSKSGRLLFAGYEDFNSYVWDVLTGERAGTLAGHEGVVSCLGINPDGTAIATGSWDTSIQVWN